MADKRFAEIHATHKEVTELSSHILEEDRNARKMKKQLEHEKVVLFERKRVSNLHSC